MTVCPNTWRLQHIYPPYFYPANGLTPQWVDLCFLFTEYLDFVTQNREFPTFPCKPLGCRSAICAMIWFEVGDVPVNLIDKDSAAHDHPNHELQKGPGDTCSL